MADIISRSGIRLHLYVRIFYIVPVSMISPFLILDAYGLYAMYIEINKAYVCLADWLFWQQSGYI